MYHYKASKTLEEASNIELSSQLACACDAVALVLSFGYRGFELGIQLMSSS